MGTEKILSLIDDVIEILKEKRCIDLNELSKLTDTESSELKHLIKLLEKEGIVKIKYKLTKTQIILNVEDEEDDDAHKHASKSRSSETSKRKY